jgi:transposase
VAGLKPYSRRADHDTLDDSAQAALDWFRTSVPERTLYNWQTAAARLVAQHLRERLNAGS